MDITTALARVVDHIDLSTEEMQDVMRQIMTGQCTDAQIGGFLVALRMKSESLDEITGAALAMRELASGVSIQGEHLVDTCGTGGDGANIFNVSSAAAFVVAAAGGQVAKHGNRAVSGKSGSADLLDAAGINLNLTPEQVARCVEHVGVGFMFAPAHHGGMKYAVGPRRERRRRTLVKMTRPITHPAESLTLIRDALGKRTTENGEKAADMIILNAGAALYAADVASSLREGVELASDALYSGMAREKMAELAAFTEVFREEALQK